MTAEGRFALEERKQDGCVFYAARCIPLGITAYGSTPEEARTRLKKMFSMLVNFSQALKGA